MSQPVFTKPELPEPASRCGWPHSHIASSPAPFTPSGMSSSDGIRMPTYGAGDVVECSPFVNTGTVGRSAATQPGSSVAAATRNRAPVAASMLVESTGFCERVKGCDGVTKFQGLATVEDFLAITKI